MKISNVYAIVMFLLASACNGQKSSMELREDNIDKIVELMTVEEKALLITGGALDKNLFEDFEKAVARVPGAAGSNNPIEKLGIPEIVLSDGPAGVRISPTRENDSETYYATAFPVGTELACSWNVDLVNEVGQAIGEEALEYGIDVMLAPALNIHRNPLCGRNFEYYSEDPLIAGKIAAAMVNGIQSNGVGTSVKHYVANNQETNRLGVDAIISERALREIYLKGFEIAVKESNPWTIMSSYNKVNGTFTSASKYLLTDILRDEWGYEGIVMTDWYGGYYGFETLTDPTAVSDVAAQVSAGNDLLMPGTRNQYNLLVKSMKDGSLPMPDVDASVTRILKTIVKSPYFKKYKYSNKPNLKHNAEVARDAATEGMVLLKNEGQVLPLLDKNSTIAVFGNTSYNFISGGTGSGDVNEAYTVSLIDGLKNAGYKFDRDLVYKYVPYVAEKAEEERQRREEAGILSESHRIPELQLPSDLIQAKAKTAAIGIITIGRNAGEQNDRKLDGDFLLAQDELDLLNEVSTAFHNQNKKVVVILNIGGVIETASWKNMVDGILLAWQPGQESGNAVADVLSGKETPSGKLTMTFPVNYEDIPSAENFPGTPVDDPKTVTYEEGVYVGYRYFSTQKVEPSYEFGYGLSYTDFKYSNLKLNSNRFDKAITVSVDITNTGKYAGKEVVQFYLSAPAKLVDKPSEELKAFAKTGLLQPGESQTIQMTLKPEDLASFIETRKAWIAEAGSYTVKAGSSCLDIRESTDFELKSEIVVEKVN